MRSINARMLCVALLILLGAIEITQAGSAPSLKTYRNTELGIEFRFPSNWVYKKCGAEISSSGDCVSFSPPRRSRRGPQEEYAMMVEVKKMALEQAIEDNGLFDRVDGGWVMQGAGMPQKAKPISGINWRGIYAVNACGVMEEGNYHAAAGECMTAVLSNGNRSVSIETGGVVSTKMVLNQVVKSFRFIE